MTLVMVLLTIAVVAGVFAVVAGLVTGGLEEPASSIPSRALPPGPLTGQDVDDLRFVQAFRGYRMDQVDAAMNTLAAEVDRLRAQLAQATGEPAAGASPLSDPDPGAGQAGPNHSVNGTSGDGSDGGPNGAVNGATEVLAADPRPAGRPAGRD